MSTQATAKKPREALLRAMRDTVGASGLPAGDRGRMKPVLLLIPGMLNTAHIWSRVAPLLADHAEIRIANVLTQASIAEMARDAWVQVADVPPSTALVLCGFSMGGYIAIEMLANASRPVSAVALLDTSARPESSEGAAVRAKTIAAIERDFPNVVEGILQFATNATNHADEVLISELRQTMLAVGREAAIRQHRAVAGRGDHRESLARLSVPMLVMCGRDDRITPPALAQELAASVPDARLEWIEQAGHMTPLEQPGRVATLLRTIL